MALMAAFLELSWRRKILQDRSMCLKGHRGIAEVVTGGEMELEKLRQPRKDWTILYTWIKNFAADGNMQGLLEATVTLVKEHDIKAEDMVEVRIKTLSHIYLSRGQFSSAAVSEQQVHGGSQLPLCDRDCGFGPGSRT